MTIVVYHQGVIAADRSHSADGKHLYDACKIVRGPGTIGAAAGTVTALQSFREWVEHDMQIELEANSNKDMLGIAFGGTVLYLVSDGVFVPVPMEQSHAIGSGAEVALGALDMGADAATAALIAARRMGCAQYGIDVCSLDTPITRIFAPKGKLNVNTF